MKKIYLLLLLCCVSFSLFAQSTTVTIYANSTAGSYITGSSTTTTRTDGNLVSSGTSAGYAVFDLSSIPAGCVIQAVTPGFYVSTYTGSGAPSGWATYGYPGDLSTVTLAGTLYADMTTTGSGATLLSNQTYGTVGGAIIAITSTPAAVSFVQANIGGKVSVSASGGASRIYTMTGETGNTTSISTAGHAPYLQISYCKTPSVATASASPTTLCAGATLSLSGSATDASNYEWDGPGGFSVSGASAATSLTATVASAGVYTLTAINACGTFSTTMTATTASVVVNPLPNPITGVSAICTGNASTLGETTFSGTWISDNPGAVSVISSSGLITGNASGVAHITYELSTGCQVTTTVTDNDPPTAISGPSSGFVCSNGVVTLTDGVAGGTWSLTPLTGSASINPSTGAVSGSSAGTISITYTTAGCLPVNYGMSVDPAPAMFGGSSLLCSNTTTTLVETTTGGTWWSSSSSTALVGSTGIVTGESAGTSTIDYILPTGCMYSQLVLVFAQPAPIVSPGHLCNGSASTLTDATSGGSFTPAVGTYASTTTGGAITATSVGVQPFTYTINYISPTPYSCAVTTDLTVNALPSAIVGPSELCNGATITYTDPDSGPWFTTTPLTVTVDIASGTLTALSAGPANIIIENAAFCSYTLNLTVNPLPASVITPVGPTTFCTGGSVVLDANTGAGLTYQWDEGGVVIPGASTSSYTASTTANFDVEVTDAKGCESTSAPTTVTAGINPVIVYTTSPSFCIGNYIVLNINTGTATGTIFYQWSLNGVAIPGAAADNFAANAPGIYTCNVSISGGSGTCTATTATPVTVVVNPIPTPVISASGLTLHTGIYSDYQWFVNTTAITGANSVTYTPHTPGSYRVEVTDANGCVGFSGAFLVDNVGVAAVNKQDISLYPNPATNMLHIQSPAAVRAVISSVEGKTILDQTNAKEIDLSNFSSGLYIISIYDENNTRILVDKLVKE